MWSSYSPRHAASLLGVPESTVRGLARAGVIAAGVLPLKLSFRDLATLRAVKALVAGGVPLARVRRELVALRQRLDAGTSLAELPLEVRDGHVAIRGEAAPLTGQLSLPFAPVAAAAPDGALHELPTRPVEAPEPAPALTGDDWFDRAIILEDSDAAAAIDAYRRAVRLRPDHVEAWINLGRLHAEAGAGPAAAECFGHALALDPTDATALYNLGVVAQDDGREADAIVFYSRALELDPGLAEAHYNLATLFDQSGDSRSAIRHINEYRKLTR
ncbi:MAG: tetratricopeptide repeat protein [Myxococcales bacterium]|nr:tetratricopeptide repeat protein [Myxococcales bacterium]